jgi:hypothetical protein
VLRSSALLSLTVLLFCPASEAKTTGSRTELTYNSGSCPSGSLDPVLPGIGDTLWSFACPPGRLGYGLAWDGEHFWMTRGNSLRLYRLDPTGTIEAEFNLPPGVEWPADLTWDGAHLWMVEEEQARAYELDTATANAIRSFRLPDSSSSDANSWGLAWDGHYLWHSDYTGTGHIYQLDTATGAVVAQFTPPRSDIAGIAWDGTYLWGVNMTWPEPSVAYKMSVPSGIVVDSFAWQVPFALGLLWDGSFFWNVGSQANRVYKVGGDAGVFDGGAAAPLPHALLSRPEPNPFAHTTAFDRDILPGRPGSVGIYDINGRLVWTLAEIGETHLTWDGRDDAGRLLPSGTYLIRCDAAGKHATVRVVLQH